MLRESITDSSASERGLAQGIWSLAKTRLTAVRSMREGSVLIAKPSRVHCWVRVVGRVMIVVPLERRPVLCDILY